MFIIHFCNPDLHSPITGFLTALVRGLSPK